MLLSDRQPPEWLVKVAHRANPVLDFEADIVAVVRAAAASTKEEWDAGTKTNVEVDGRGIVRLDDIAGGTSLFAQTLGVGVNHALAANDGGVEEYCLNFFPDPSVVSGSPFELLSLQLHLGKAWAVALPEFSGVFVVNIGIYDEVWRPVKIGWPIEILSSAVTRAGGLVTIDLTQGGQRFVFESGMMEARTGPGRDAAGAQRTANVDPQGVSRLRVHRGFWISITPNGQMASNALIGLTANAVVAQFDVNQFWRVAVDRITGPYPPERPAYPPADVQHNPDDHLITGAVPGYGAVSHANGLWGIARRVTNPQSRQAGGGAERTWERPYFDLKIRTFPSSGSIVKVLDLGAVATKPVELRLDDLTPKGTSIAYTMRGSNTSATGPWTSIGSVVDGQEFTGANLFRWYELTAAFTPGPSGATKYATPGLQAFMLVERTRYSTHRYLRELDATAEIDPTNGQSKVAELTLPVMKLGPRDYRDLATTIATSHAASRIEAQVYAVNALNRSQRYYLNSFRLESRTPKDTEEEFVFVSGFDRLKVMIPPKVESHTFVSLTITAIGVPTGTKYPITCAGAGFPTAAPGITQMRYQGVTGNTAKKSFPIEDTPLNTSDTFTVDFLNANNIPAVNDKIEIHSDAWSRPERTYPGEEFASVYADVIGIQAAVPSRLRGRPPTAANPPRLTSSGARLTSDGRTALDVLREVALHCDGALAWEKGRIQFVDLFNPKVSRAWWDERHLVGLETPIGADRRMPSIVVKHDYDHTAARFRNERTYDDLDAVNAWGRANLFDITALLQDELCKWNDAAEALRLAQQLLKVFATGVRIWPARTVLPWPWLELGDGVTIVTDQYTDRLPIMSGDGLVDEGIPIAGRLAVSGVIVGKNLRGDRFAVFIPGLHAITTAVSGTGTLGGSLANPTYGTPVGQAAQISYPFTYDDPTVKIEWWSKESASDPGAIVHQDNASGATLVTITRRDDLRSSIVIPTTTNSWRLTTRVAYDRFNRRGTTSTVKAQAAGTAPGAPGTPTSVSETSTSVTNRVPTNASSTTAWKIRTYRNGAQWGSDINVAAGAGANQDVVHSGLDVGTSYTWEYSHVDGSGLESAKSASLTHATATETLSAPTLEGVERLHGGSTLVADWTPAPNTPVDTLYKVYDSSVSGGPYTERASTTSTSKTVTTTHNPAYVVVKATKAGDTDSANSNQLSA